MSCAGAFDDVEQSPGRHAGRQRVLRGVHRVQIRQCAIPAARASIADAHIPATRVHCGIGHVLQLKLIHCLIRDLGDDDGRSACAAAARRGERHAAVEAGEERVGLIASGDLHGKGGARVCYRRGVIKGEMMQRCGGHFEREGLRRNRTGAVSDLRGEGVAADCGRAAAEEACAAQCDTIRQ